LGCWVKRIKDLYPEGDRDFLLRVKSTCNVKVLEILKDGSAWVEIEVKGEKIQLREIRGQLRRPGGEWSSVRLWTSLKDWKECPAEELLALYGRSWEQEIFYEELKVDMRSAELLKSHTERTAMQEIAALILAHAILVDQRMAAATEAAVDVLRISFKKTLHFLEPLWMILQCSEGLLANSGDDAAGHGADCRVCHPSTKKTLLPTGSAPTRRQLAPIGEEHLPNRRNPIINHSHLVMNSLKAL